MKVFRGTQFRVFVIAFWCAILLNMNFYVVEVKALKSENKALIEQAKKLLSEFTEEEDSSETTNTGSSLVEDLSSLLHQHVNFSNISSIALRNGLTIFKPGMLLNGHYETFSPPPEFLS
jgi:poly(3-hydroxyalkanoate) synthetase